MRRALLWSFAIALLVSGAAFAQSSGSLGDVARANRAKQEAQQASGTAPKVITNQDLPANSSGIPDPDPSDPMTQVSGLNRPDRYADRQLSSRLASEQRTAAQWKARIQDQENRIADLQGRIDRLNAAIRGSFGTAQYDTPANRDQAFQLDRLAMMQQMLGQQRRRLEMMEDAARHAGME
jgi:hypothetical protein